MLSVEISELNLLKVFIPAPPLLVPKFKGNNSLYYQNNDNDHNLLNKTALSHYFMQFC
jgi:hypothetical protein